MKLHEYQTKQIIARYGIPVPGGYLVSSAEEAYHAAHDLGGWVVLKAQVLANGRGKAGGILLAKSPQQARDRSHELFDMEIKGLPVNRILVEQAAEPRSELYLAISIDRATRLPVVIASAAGGVDIEETFENDPGIIASIPVDPWVGVRTYHANRLAQQIDLPHPLWRSFSSITASLWKAFIENDALLAEINPLAVTNDDKLLALDARLVLDDNAQFRHTNLAEWTEKDSPDPLEEEARQHSLSYVRLGGNIGCLVNGAGLAMSTNDLIHSLGGKPANFLDIGGGAGSEKVISAMHILLSHPNLRAVLINIFGGITRCDIVAKGILEALNKYRPTVPIIVRLEGTRAEEGLATLAECGVIIVRSFSQAAARAIAAAGGET